MDKHFHTFSTAESLEELDESFVQQMLALRDKGVTGGSSWSMEANGGWRRVLVSCSGIVPSSGFNVYELDATQDYRDRLWWFSGVRDQGDSRIVYPGSPDDQALNDVQPFLGTGRIYYSGPGYADPFSTTDEYFKSGAEPGAVMLWARASDGALMMGVSSAGFAEGAQATAMGLLYVSPALNVRGSETPGRYSSAMDGALTKALDSLNMVDPLALTWTPDGATVTPGQADPMGGTNAVLITDAAFSVSHAYAGPIPVTTPFAPAISLLLKKDPSGQRASVAVQTDVGDFSEAVVDLDTGEVTSVPSGFWTFRPQAYDAGEWWAFVLVHDAFATGTTLRVRVGSDGAVSGSVTVFGLRVADASLAGGDPTSAVAGPFFVDGADGDFIEPHDLNNLQDGQHVEQMPGEGAFPLGPIVHGNPPIPYEWTVHEERVRQRLHSPQIRRFAVFEELDAGDRYVIDREADWRDRLVHGLLVFSRTTVRLPGVLAPAEFGGTFAAADIEMRTFVGYIGGESSEGSGVSTIVAGGLPIPGHLEVDLETGWLYWNLTDSTDDIASGSLLLFSSPRLGPRSIGLPDARALQQDPTLGKVSRVLTDSASADLDGIVARWRMDRGIARDGGRVAAIADQTGRGHHLRQLLPSRRATLPEPRTALNGALAIGFTGAEFYETVKPLPESDAGYHVAMVLEPDDVTVSFEPWKPLLPLAGEGQLAGRLVGTNVFGEWRASAAAEPPSMALASHPGLAPASRAGIGWDFVRSGDLLVPQVAIQAAGSVSTSVLVSSSPVGAGDVQSLVWRLFEGFRGYVAEVIVCEAGQGSADAFFTSADIAARYGF